MDQFQFDLNAPVALVMSGEKGKIIGRAEYASQPPGYLVRYVAADGRQCEGWFEAQALR